METKEQYQVCIVCTGNACRSPFVEYALKKFISEQDSLNINVYSCGTLDWGSNPRDPKMAFYAEHMGFPMEGQTTHMTRDLLLKADRIIVFEAKHRDRITEILDSSHWDRIVLFDMIAFGYLSEVDDPYQESDVVYLTVARHLEEGCHNIVEKWLTTPPIKR